MIILLSSFNHFLQLKINPSNPVDVMCQIMYSNNISFIYIEPLKTRLTQKKQVIGGEMQSVSKILIKTSVSGVRSSFR